MGRVWNIPSRGRRGCGEVVKTGMPLADRADKPADSIRGSQSPEIRRQGSEVVLPLALCYDSLVPSP
jgi:hypothetical protein